MPQRTKKHKSHRRSTKAYSKRPTIREHGFRIVRHNLPVKGAPRSMKNIHLSLSNRIPRSNKSKKANVMNIAGNTRASLHRSAKSAQQIRREQEQMLEQFKKNNRAERKEQKVVHSSAMSNLNAMMGKFHL
jgi:hypothetical protein